MAQTFVKLKADKVINACEKWLVNREIYRKELRENLIKAELSKFWVSKKTREKAEQRVDANDSYGFPPEWQWKGSKWDGEIEHLLLSAKTSLEYGDGYVTTEDVLINKIQEYLQ